MYDSTFIAHERTSAETKWDRFELPRPGSMFLPASDGLGWGVPAAIGLQLGNPSRRVLATLGDGAIHYIVSAVGMDITAIATAYGIQATRVDGLSDLTHTADS